MTIFTRIWAFISKLWNGLSSETKSLAPVAIKIIQGIKTVMDSPVDDIITFVIKNAIPGSADDVLIDKINATVKEWLPKILIDLNIANAIANINDPNKQLQAILEQLKLSSNETKNIFYHGFCSLILEKLSDGELSWSDSTAIAEYYYKNLYIKPQ